MKYIERNPGEPYVPEKSCSAWKYLSAILLILLFLLACFFVRHIREHKKSEKSIILIKNAIDRIDRVCKRIERRQLILFMESFPKDFEYPGTTHENKAGREPDKGFDAPGFLNVPGVGGNPVVISRDRSPAGLAGTLQNNRTIDYD